MKLLKAAIFGITAVTMAVCLTAPADEPATRPAADNVTVKPAPESPRLRGQQLRQILRALSGNTNNVHPFTQQEWDDMMTFLEENSHARWYVLSNMHLPDNSPIRLGAIREWRNYTFTKEHFPAVADEMKKRYRLEDELFGLTIKAVSGNQDIDEIRELIRNKITEMVKLDLNERQLRIEKLQKLLDTEKQNLDRDQTAEEQVIEQRTNVMMARLERLNATSRPSSSATQPTSDGAHDPIVNTSEDSDPNSAN